MNRLKACLEDESAQVVVITALCMVMLLSFVGLAIDVGHLRLARRQTQTLADAAAMAGGLEIRVCSSTSSCSAMQSAVKAALAENGKSATFLMNCATPGTELTVTLNDPPCALGTKDPNRGNTKYVEAVVTQEVRTWFARAVGYDHVKITARAEARRGVDPCIWALDPHASSAMTVPVAIAINANCGVVVESDSPTALTCLVAFGSAPKINVTGGTGPFICATAPPVNKGVPVPTPADPMAYLPAPPQAAGACGTDNGVFKNGAWNYTGSKNAVNVLALGNYIFNPGVYCGGISFTATVAANITFKPGIYILRDGTGIGTQGGLTITAPTLSSLTGTGVMFYNQGNINNPAASVGGFSITAPLLSNLNLSADTQGQYGGVLFFQAHNVTTSGTYLVKLLSTGKLEGAIYEPDAKVAYAVGLLTSSYNILVARQLNFTAEVLSNFKADFSALANGSPLHGDTAVLVQ